jgi:hypothetical protein
VSGAEHSTSAVRAPIVLQLHVGVTGVTRPSPWLLGWGLWRRDRETRLYEEGHRGDDGGVKKNIKRVKMRYHRWQYTLGGFFNQVDYEEGA